MKARPHPLGEMLLLYRTVHRLNLRELGKVIGIGHATLMRIETGKQCDVPTFLKLVRWLVREADPR